MCLLALECIGVCTANELLATATGAPMDAGGRDHVAHAFSPKPTVSERLGGVCTAASNEMEVALLWRSSRHMGCRRGQMPSHVAALVLDRACAPAEDMTPTVDGMRSPSHRRMPLFASAASIWMVSSH